MYTYSYYLIAAPERPRAACSCYRVRLDEVTTVVGDRPPDVTADVAELLDGDAAADEERALRARSRRLPPGAGIYWRLNRSTGEAEGWRVESPPAV